MGYIRDNEDYYVSMGYSPDRAREQCAIDDANIDYGYCNPIKAKQAAEDEQEIRERVRSGGI
jgi:hypothetical protein